MIYLRAFTSALVLAMLAGPATAFGDQIFVLNKQSNSMSIVDSGTFEVTSTVSVGEQPHEMAILPGGDKAYVSNVGENSISVVDLKEGAETGKITTPDFSFPHGIAFTPDSRIAIVTSERTQKIVVIDARTDEILRSIDTAEAGTHMVVIDDTGRWAYFTNRESNTVSVMDLNDYRIVASIPVGEGAEGIALSPDGKQIWTGDRRGDTVTVIDTETRRVIQKLPAGGAPIRVAFSPDGSRVFVPNSISSDVFVYAADSREHIKTIEVGGGPGGVVFSADGRYAYVACGGAGSVYAIDTATLEVSGQVSVGEGPDGITYQ
jgi:YVTN family beta-propeller protein